MKKLNAELQNMLKPNIRDEINVTNNVNLICDKYKNTNIIYDFSVICTYDAKTLLYITDVFMEENPGDIKVIRLMI